MIIVALTEKGILTGRSTISAIAATPIEIPNNSAIPQLHRKSGIELSIEQPRKCVQKCTIEK